MTAILDLSETTAAGFRFPVMTTSQRNSIVAPQEGLLIFNSTEGCIDGFNGTEWMCLNEVKAGALATFMERRRRELFG